MTTDYMSIPEAAVLRGTSPDELHRECETKRISGAVRFGLSQIEPDEIICQSNVDFSTNRTALRFARVIRDKYNGQKRGGRKLPYRFKD